MKEIINIEIKTRTADCGKCKADMVAIGVFSDAGLDKIGKQLDSKFSGAISRLLESGDFKAKNLTSAVVYNSKQTDVGRILLVGLGEKKKATLDTLRKAAAAAANKAVLMKIKNLTFAVHLAFGTKSDLATVGQICAEGIYFGSYRYDEFVTQSKDARLDSLCVELIEFDSAKTKKLKSGVDAGIIIGKAQSYARTLANRPGNVINPAKLAEIAKEIARNSKELSCTIFDEKQLAAKSMGGILAVGSGSENKPRFIILKYTPKARVANKNTIGLVGKAITFDSGGISIKPSNGMQEMKFDKCGGIAVLATMKAIAELKLPINVYGFIPTAENMPSGTSYRPGDIITTFSGKTVEVQNTDAEGRMILCDALSYAAKQNCETIVDIATLTGACAVALGKYMAGLMSNDDKLVKQLQKAAKFSGEKVWHLPSGDEYAKEMKSKIADLKNIGGRWGGACTAAAFLKQFIGDAKWAHLDMAGVDMFEKPSEFSTAGSSGFGVRLLTTYVINAAKK
ncbi:MAG: leucyl aminopeptidase [Planctomycetes bacterium]|nr:leucyl aminopeptidase [Planctomycetota bacterium]